MGIKFHFIVTTRNSEKWMARCLQSLLSQKDQEFTITVVDDASDDNTALVALGELSSFKNSHMKINIERLGAPPNQYWAIQQANPAPDDVIVIVDGDDYLAHDNVLNRLAQVYEDNNIEMTYGSYEPTPPSATCPAVLRYPYKVAMQRSFREFTRTQGCYFNHLRTFRYRLFSQIDPEKNFKWPNGEWFEYGADYAFMIPMLELAGTNYRFIPEVLLMYNSENPASDWRTSADVSNLVTNYILTKLPPVKGS